MPRFAEKGAITMSNIAKGLVLSLLVAVSLMAIVAPGAVTQAGVAAQVVPPRGMSPTSTPATPSPSPTITPSATPRPECGPAWTLSDSQNLGFVNDYLNDVAIRWPYSDIWAVGRSFYSYPGPSQLLIERYSGSSWSIVPAPRPGYDNELSGVAIVSPSDVWAVGFYGTYLNEQTLALHWDGTTWSQVPSPSVISETNYLTEVAALASNDVWAVGYSLSVGSSRYRTLTLHWDGTQWSIVSSPNPDNSINYLFGVAAASANDVWAVGQYGQPAFGAARTLTMHWNGTQWSVVPSPNGSRPNSTLADVVAMASNNVWAVGATSNIGGARQPLSEHWDGTQWSIVPAPGGTSSEDAFLTGVSAAGSELWAVGGTYNAPDGAFTLRWNGSAWALVPTTALQYSGYFSRIAVLEPRFVWAVGSHLAGSATQTFGERYIGNFTDVHPDDYFFEGVRYLYCLTGGISGYGDFFLPYNNTTRGQLAKIIVLAEQWPIYTPPTPTFQDVPTTHAFYQYIETAYNHGIISGYNCGTGCLEYRPSNNVTRGQLCKIVVLAEQWPLKDPSVPTFSDVPASHPFYQYVETAYAHGIISGYSGGTFRPDGNSTRGQICKIVYNAVTAP